MYNSLLTERSPATNKVLPKAWLNGFDWAFVQGSTFVLRVNFCTKNPRLRQYPKRYQLLYRPLRFEAST